VFNAADLEHFTQVVTAVVAAIVEIVAAVLVGVFSALIAVPLVGRDRVGGRLVGFVERDLFGQRFLVHRQRACLFLRERLEFEAMQLTGNLGQAVHWMMAAIEKYAHFLERGRIARADGDNQLFLCGCEYRCVDVLGFKVAGLNGGTPAKSASPMPHGRLRRAQRDDSRGMLRKRPANGQRFYLWLDGRAIPRATEP
jgi:hypothetical protein